MIIQLFTKLDEFKTHTDRKSIKQDDILNFLITTIPKISKSFSISICSDDMYNQEELEQVIDEKQVDEVIDETIH